MAYHWGQVSISLGMKALGLLWVGTLVPLTATTISVTLGGSSCDPAGTCTSNPGATTITFDPLLSWTTSPYVTGDVTYTWSGLNTPFVQDSVDGNYASPPGDTTPYLTIGSPYRPASVTIDFSKPIYYFGFYMGSPDDYNEISFYGGPDRSLIQTISGDQLIQPRRRELGPRGFRELLYLRRFRQPNRHVLRDPRLRNG